MTEEAPLNASEFDRASDLGWPSILSVRRTRLVADELERVDLGEMNIQPVADEENQDRAQCGKNEAGGMISFICRARKHLGNGAADDGSDDAEHDRPEDCHMHVHDRFRDNS
jgi:hypothetical protein